MKTTSPASSSSSRLIATALAAAEELSTPDSGSGPALRRATAVAELLASLDADEDTVVGSLIAPLIRDGTLTAEAAAQRFG